jgi:hypothetical protein
LKEFFARFDTFARSERVFLRVLKEFWLRWSARLSHPKAQILSRNPNLGLQNKIIERLLSFPF